MTRPGHTNDHHKIVKLPPFCTRMHYSIGGWKFNPIAKAQVVCGTVYGDIHYKKPWDQSQE